MTGVLFVSTSFCWWMFSHSGDLLPHTTRLLGDLVIEYLANKDPHPHPRALAPCYR